MRALLLAICLTVTSLGACTPPAPREGEVVTVEGRVVLKGNEPFILAVLDTGNQQWELRGLTRAQILALQSRTVAVTGKVVGPVGGAGTGLPLRLEVQSIQ
ncbi:MAG: hypothetical protein QHC78_02310 [Pigmentiphaga sp.]|uniref:hypothetical protein n=1 Tax=Pigmentiphaga sp. TaxID=1977564 RepID=UPI0029A32CC3|nr:hypothetical protein [Pigmentiphaga sp.]MDX3904509.1 hypothetical protein [Pigmentiphaga sp.]